jgi:eukaryotic-like serine/threonine-protein kinase
MDRTACPAAERLDRLLDGDLPAGERDRVAAHLDDCPHCQDRVERRLTNTTVEVWRRTSADRTEPGPPAEFLNSMRRLVPLVAASPVALAEPETKLSGPGLVRPGPGPIPKQIGGYEILKVLGRGGMAVVYQARQPGLGRFVALKWLSPSAGPGLETARFLREAAAVGRMRHPNIVQVYEVGEHDGRPFLALEYVPGGTLADRLRGTPINPREAAALLEQVARAVHHAHEQGIVHRDLKPSNILLSPQPLVPSHQSSSNRLRTGDSGLGTPKVTDFGLARAVDDDQSLTQPEVIVGTPTFLAPEVIRHPESPPAPAADVWAQGVILYEMLTGHLPLVGPTALATLRLIEAADPVPPGRLQPQLPRDLDTICMAALQKDPRRRYATALALADDLRRFLDGRPIRARRVGRLEAGWLWCRRNPAVAGLGAALAVAVLAGLAAALILLGEARQSAADARANAERAGANEVRALASAADAAASARLANDRTYGSDLQFANQMWVNRQYAVLVDLLDGQRPERTDGIDRRGFEWHFLWATSHAPHRTVSLPRQAWDLAAGRDGSFLAVATGDPAVELLDADGRPVRTLTAAGGKVIRVCVSADGRRVAGGSEDGTTHVWAADSGRLIRTLAGHRGLVTGARFLPDGRTLVTVGLDGTLRVSDVDDVKAEPRVVRVPGLRFHCVAVNPDGKRVAAGGSDGTVRVWDVEPWAERSILRGHTGDVLSVAFSPTGDLLASGSRDHGVRLWDPAARKSDRTLPGHLDAVAAVVFSPDGRRLASASFDRSVRVTDVDTGTASRILLGHGDFVLGAVFGPAGTLATTGWDQTVRFWDLAAAYPYRVWRGHDKPVRATEFAPGGELATAAMDGTVRLWDPAAGTETGRFGPHAGGVTSLSFDPAGRRLATAGGDGVRIWDVASRQVEHTAAGPSERVTDVRFDPAGKLLGAGFDGGSVYVWDAAAGWAGRALTKLPAAVTCLRFDPTGTILAVGSRNGTVTTIDVSTGHTRQTLGDQTGVITSLDISPDSRRLAAASTDRTIRVWDEADGTLVRTLRGHVRAVTAVRFSPDGRRLFSGSQDQTVRIWQADSGQPLVTLSEPDEVTALAVDRTGHLEASVGPKGLIGVRTAGR